jgi:hypothetical protein
VKNYFRLHTSIAFGKPPVKSVKSQTVMVEMEVDLLLPFGSNITFAGFELDGEGEAPLDEEVVEAAFNEDTVPSVDVAAPIG